MPGPAQDQPPNLKHRLTGAVILIGIAVAVMSLVLDSEPPRQTVDTARDSPSESFVSRISSPEESGESRVPAPTTMPENPLEPLAEEASDVIAETSRDADAEAPGGPASRPDAPESGLAIEPVLEQHTRLPAPAPKINTVDVSPVGSDAGPQASGDSRSEVASTGSWVVRVGAFSEQSNARGIRRQLRESGYETSSASVTVNGKSMVRVWVGPFPDRKSAVRAKSDLSRQFGLDGFVARQP